MSILQTATTSFKVQLLQGVHNFSADVFKIALYTANVNLNADTAAYSASNEVTGVGYTAGGNTLVVNPVPTSGVGTNGVAVAYISFNNTSWADASFTARAALIYNSSQSNASVAVLDFGADKTVANNIFLIVFPTADISSAIIRVA